MNQITQGSIIQGVRFKNYASEYCSAIVITARCDLANEGKVAKVFYLCAIPLKEWVLSRKGISIIAAKEIKKCKGEFERICEQYGLDSDVLLQFSEEEIHTVISDPGTAIPNKDSIVLLENIRYLHGFRSEKFCEYRLIEMLRDERFKKDVIAKIKEIADGKNTHLCFIPQDAYRDDRCLSDGLIVDLEEIDYFTTQVKQMIEEYKIDKEVLKKHEFDKWNEVFNLSEGPGYIVVDACLKSPWIEYLMQRFSNSFIRIGVDNMQKEHVQQFISDCFH